MVRPPRLERGTCGLGNRTGTTVSNGGAGSCDNAACDFAACLARARQDDVALARLVEAWPTLPEAVKAGIAAMVEASVGKAAQDK